MSCHRRISPLRWLIQEKQLQKCPILKTNKQKSMYFQRWASQCFQMFFHLMTTAFLLRFRFLSRLGTAASFQATSKLHTQKNQPA
jgi:hypothetical protein